MTILVQEFTIRTAGGLHARPARQLVGIAKSFTSGVKGVNLAQENSKTLNLKSLMGALGLGVKQGNRIQISVTGDDANQAMAAIAQGIADGLGEAIVPEPVTAEAPAIPEPSQAAAAQSTILQSGEHLTAIAASPGIAIGEAFVLKHQKFSYPERAADSAAEKHALSETIAKARADLKQLETELRERAGDEQAEIMAVQQELLEDPELLEQSETLISQGNSAAHAWAQVIESAAQHQAALDDPLLAERAADLRDLGRRVLATLLGQPLQSEMPDRPYILLAEDVGPSEVVGLDTDLVQAICTSLGGASSHSAILARSLGIPALVGCGAGILQLSNDTPLIVDGSNGQLHVSPAEEILEAKKKALAELKARQAADFAVREQPAVTTDGHGVEVMANIGDAESAAGAMEQGAEGIGLLRTEFLFMTMNTEPSLETQIEQYRKIFAALNGQPLVARTLDVGGDKPLPYWPMAEEENPFLGVRGVRLCLQKPDILERQVRALLIASENRPVRIMLPMIGQFDEWLQAKALIDKVQADIQCQDLQVGMMMEVPSAALLADVFAREADFFSIGTNDLTQYTLAIDRGHSALSAQADAIHPAVLRLIELTVKAAHAHGKWVGVCGELGSDPQAVPILVGLGVDELSVSAKAVPGVKAAIRSLSLPQAQARAEAALGCATAEDVRQLH